MSTLDPAASAGMVHWRPELQYEELLVMLNLTAASGAIETLMLRADPQDVLVLIVKRATQRLAWRAVT